MYIWQQHYLHQHLEEKQKKKKKKTVGYSDVKNTI